MTGGQLLYVAYNERGTNIRIISARKATSHEYDADELVNLLFAVEPHTGGSPQRLYFGDEVPGQSDAGQKVAQENHRNMAGKKR